MVFIDDQCYNVTNHHVFVQAPKPEPAVECMDEVQTNYDDLVFDPDDTVLEYPLTNYDPALSELIADSYLDAFCGSTRYFKT